MTEEQIRELFIRAAEVDRKLPDTARPAALRAINHGYVHDTADMNGWFAEDKHDANWAWLDPNKIRNSRNDIGIWQAAMEVIKLVPNEQHRRALWAWARGEAGGQAFAKWCKTVEGISRQVGNYRKNAAILQIARAFDRKPLQHSDLGDDEPLTNSRKSGINAPTSEFGAQTKASQPAASTKTSEISLGPRLKMSAADSARRGRDKPHRPRSGGRRRRELQQPRRGCR